MNTLQQSAYIDLISKLEAESVKLVPMLQSKFYTEITAAGEDIVPLLVSSVEGTTVKYYLTLMAIAGINAKALQQVPVEMRLSIYSDTLQTGRPQNDWGLAGEYLSGASLDLVSIGKKAIPCLIPFLDDTARAGIWGSEEATIDEQYQNRVCDFAYYLILRILNRTEPYFKTPLERDASIDSLKKSLAGYLEKDGDPVY